MENKATGGMDTHFDKGISCLKNFVSTISTTHINISNVDTD